MSMDLYPQISDYGYIGDCHSAALISKTCSIDWCCMPRMDSPSCFGRLLDWRKGGYCRISPSEACEWSRRYMDKSLILETRMTGRNGGVRVVDCFTMREGGEYRPHRQILRVIEGIDGKMDVRININARFDYGAVRPWLRSYKENSYIAMGGSHGLLISGDVAFEICDRHDMAASVSVEKGQRFRLSLQFHEPSELDEGKVQVPDNSELDRRLEETREWWEKWASSSRVTGQYADAQLRSALILKGLSNAPTGAIAAAPTTSLPEVIGGQRNWDYRYSWIRDSAFTVRSLAQVGHIKEADGFRRFVERTAAGSAEDLQVVFGVGGERRLMEMEIQEMEGYARSSPVRIGNRAQSQIQLDVYGEILELAWTWFKQGHEPDDDYWDFLVDVLNVTAEKWCLPDSGIWEMRGEPRHFVQSKAMCWSALDRGCKIAEALKRSAPVEKWNKTRDEIKASIEKNGYDPKRGVFIQAYGHPQMDAALLLLPNTGFLEYRDERMVRTVDLIRDELEQEGLLRRYKSDGDGLAGEEGVFLACSFWLAECLARQDRIDAAHTVFKKVLSTGNDLLLFSEEYDPYKKEMLGNFPQGLTHLSLITAAVALDGT